MNVDYIKEALDFSGFNLLAVLDLQHVDVPDDLPSQGSLLLIGNAGDALWDALPQAYRQLENPIDDYTRDTVQQILEQHHGTVSWRLLFPSVDGAGPNLQSLGTVAGWHHPSPLGNGIHHRYGLWFAYRAVIWIDQALPATPVARAESPCVSCTGQPCLRACPAQALAVGKPPDLLACSAWRTALQSSCASTCLARISCPVAPQWRYSDDQIEYYYATSLPSLQQWVQQRDD